MLRRFILIMVVVGVAATAQAPKATRIGPASAYPPPQITGGFDPAVTQATIKTTVCVSGYTATVRAVSEATKKSVLKRDGQLTPGCCEVDHFASLENGGSNDPDTNLWAEPYAGKYGARVKDAVETKLHRLLCTGKMTLKEDQDCLTSDWIACGIKIGAVR